MIYHSDAAGMEQGAAMTKEELIEFFYEITGGNADDLSADQIERLLPLLQHLANLSLNERRSFGNLCALRAIIGAAVTPGGTTDDLVTLHLSKEHCAFLLALIDQEIRQHAWDRLAGKPTLFKTTAPLDCSSPF